MSLEDKLFFVKKEDMSFKRRTCSKPSLFGNYGKYNSKKQAHPSRELYLIWKD